MSMWMLLTLGTLAVVVVMWLLWLLGLKLHNFSYVDLGWSANFVLLAVIYATLSHGDPTRRFTLALMYTLWGGRLAWHLATRIVGEPEEGRYVQLRQEWGAKGHLHLRFLAFFQLQAALNLVLSLPLLLAAVNPAPALHWLEWSGLVIWSIALMGESVADAQLKSFKLNPAHRGKVCRVGLWNWSRHPNYFFEWCIWIGYAVFALASPYGWLCLTLPVLMLHFLVNVTGVKATEEQALRSKGVAYAAYQHEVSAFVPRRPRTSTTATTT